MQRSGQQVVTRSLRIARIIGQDEVPSVSDSSVALEILSSMLDVWRHDSEFVPDDCDDFSVPSFSGLRTPVDADPALLAAIYYNLAVMLAPEFGSQVEALVQRTATAYRRVWTRKVAALSIGRMDLEMGYLPYRGGSYDIETDQ